MNQDGRPRFSTTDRFQRDGVPTSETGRLDSGGFDTLHNPNARTRGDLFLEFFQPSKLRTKEGLPIPMYHATESEFEELRPEYLGTNTGVAILTPAC